MLTRRRGLLGGGVVAALAALTVVGLLLGRAGPPSRSSAPPSVSTPSAGASDSPPAPGLAETYLDGPFESTLTHEPTGGEGQAKVWFNDGVWWAILVEPVSQGLRIARLDWPTQHWVDTGTLVDERLHARADALWDGTHLTIVSAGDKPLASQAARVIRYHYDRPGRRYLVDPDFPITMTTAGVGDATIARDSAGILWLAYLDAGQLVVRHSLADDLHWTPRLAFPVDGADGLTRTVALDADGKRVAVAWNRVDETTLHVALHVDGAAADSWTTTSTSVDGLANAPGGLSARGDVGPSGSRLLVAFETASDTATTANPLAPGAVVMVLDPDGSWANVQLARVKDHLSVPVLAIDHGAGVVYAIATSSSTGEVTYKQSPLDHPAFEAGRGDRLIGATDTPAIRNPSVTRQPVDGAAGFVVLAADDGAGRYVHGAFTTGADLPAPGQPAPAPPAEFVNTLVHDTFDPWAPGTRAPSDWVGAAQGGGAGRLAVIAVPGAGNALQVITTSAVGSLRACKTFAPVDSGVITATELIRLDGVGTSDATLLSIRGPGGEAASLRVNRHSVLAYYNRAAKVATAATFARSGWYRVKVVVHVATRTWDWTVTASTGRIVGRATGVHWRVPDVPAIDAICAQSSQGRGNAVDIADLEVRH